MPTVSSTRVPPHTSCTATHIWQLGQHTAPWHNRHRAPSLKARFTNVSNIAAEAEHYLSALHRRARQGRRVTTDALRGKRAPWYGSLGMTRPPDSQTADIQIRFLFTSPPPFSTTENPTETVDYSLGAVTDPTQLRQTPQSMQHN